MAWIQQRKRSDGGTSARVEWRLGGGRGGPRQEETFAAGTDEQNLARAEGFKKMVEATGGFWPEGWVKGEGFVRARCGDVYTPPPPFHELGAEYVRQIVDLSPGQRRRYLDQLGVLARIEIRGALMFTRSVAEISEHDRGTREPGLDVPGGSSRSTYRDNDSSEVSARRGSPAASRPATSAGNRQPPEPEAAAA